MTAPVTLPRELVERLLVALEKVSPLSLAPALRQALTAAPSERREPTREEVAVAISGAPFPTKASLAKADRVLALFRGEA